MSVTQRMRYIELYEEFLEEASFLFEHRLGLLDDPEVNWMERGDFEERFEAQVDGLMVGETLALEVCRERAADGDAGELHAALRVFCRSDLKDEVFAAADGFDPEDDEAPAAVREALKHEVPAAWFPQVVQRLTPDHADRLGLWAVVAGFRRVETATASLVGSLRWAREEDLCTVMWALGRLRPRSPRSILEPCLRHADPAIRFAAQGVLARCGTPDIGALTRLARDGVPGAWPLLATVSEPGPARDILAEPAAAPESCLALGLIGDAQAIPHLLERLGHEESAEQAALGLHALTGALPIEEIFIEDEIDPDALNDDDRQAQEEEGRPPLAADGKPFGQNVERLSQNQDEWRAWCDENAKAFPAGQRVRLGQPCSPTVLVHQLARAETPHPIRRWTAEELVCRHQCPVRFETDQIVPEQLASLAELFRWAPD